MADRVTVMEDGVTAGTHSTARDTTETLIELMVDERMESQYARPPGRGGRRRPRGRKPKGGEATEKRVESSRARYGWPVATILGANRSRRPVGSQTVTRRPCSNDSTIALARWSARRP
jgi:hypothetical protein